MKTKKPYFISICSQKGGVGKSTLTVMIAGLLHYHFGRRVLVADCDYPQWSIQELRSRELALLDHTEYYKLMMIRLFKHTREKIWPLLACQASTALEQVRQFLETSDASYDYVLFDLPGTTATKGVLKLIASVDQAFIPMKADKMIMESTITFARMIAETFVVNPDLPIQGVHLFWSMIDRRARTALYAQYEKALAIYKLPLLEAHIPLRMNFNKELRPDSGPVYRSTLFPPSGLFAAQTSLSALCEEMISITERR